jgi:ATP dependent DNA ligase C terminal region
MQECRWLRPVLVAQLEYVEWTADAHLRHSRFIALREDKKSRMCGGNEAQGWAVSAVVTFCAWFLITAQMFVNKGLKPPKLMSLACLATCPSPIIDADKSC